MEQLPPEHAAVRAKIAFGTRLWQVDVGIAQKILDRADGNHAAIPVHVAT